MTMTNSATASPNAIGEKSRERAGQCRHCEQRSRALRSRYRAGTIRRGPCASWLLARFAGLEFDEVMVSPDDPTWRKELLLLAPSIRVPCLSTGARVWNTLASRNT